MSLVRPTAQRPISRVEDFGFSMQSIDAQPLRQFRLSVGLILVLGIASACVGFSQQVAATAAHHPNQALAANASVVFVR